MNQGLLISQPLDEQILAERSLGEHRGQQLPHVDSKDPIHQAGHTMDAHNGYSRLQAAQMVDPYDQNRLL